MTQATTYEFKHTDKYRSQDLETFIHNSIIILDDDAFTGVMSWLIKDGLILFERDGIKMTIGDFDASFVTFHAMGLSGIFEPHKTKTIIDNILLLIKVIGKGYAEATRLDLKEQVKSFKS